MVTPARAANSACAARAPNMPPGLSWPAQALRAFARHYTNERAPGEHVCMDWPESYDGMKSNYIGW